MNRIMLHIDMVIYFFMQCADIFFQFFSSPPPPPDQGSWANLCSAKMLRKSAPFCQMYDGITELNRSPSFRFR